MFSNDKIIEKTKQSLFEETEKAFNEIFAPFIIGKNSFDPNSVSVDRDIEIEDEPPIKFFSTDKDDEEEKSDSFNSFDIIPTSMSNSQSPTKKKKSTTNTSKKTLIKRKQLKKKALVV